MAVATMMTIRWMVALSVALGLVLSAHVLVPSAAAILPEAPPEIGAVVLEDSLAAPGVLGPPGACPSGRNVREFVGEGTIVKVTGRCTEAGTNASLAQRIGGLTVPDGEVRLEFKIVSGIERATLGLDARAGSDARYDAYSVLVYPSGGAAQLRRTIAGQSTVLANQGNLAGIVSPDDWNSLAVRMQGPGLWVLLNDHPILSASDDAITAGSVLFGLLRSGDLDDRQEAAVVMRNLRVSALASGDLAREPSYQSPRSAAEPAGPSGPSWIGDIAFGYDRTGAGAVPAGGTLSDVSSGEIYGFFSWRNIPPGARIAVKILWGGEERGRREFVPRQPNGQAWLGIMTFDSDDGGAKFTFPDVGMIFLLDGKEIARGSVALP